MSNNDFTLEELKFLLESVCIRTGDVTPIEKQLESKLQDMIANYCDHDFQNTYNVREVWTCSKCGIE